MTRARGAALLVLVAFGGAPAAAHERTVSYSTWEIDGGRARITVRLTALDVSRLPWAATAGGEIDRRLGAYLSERLTLRADGAPCPLASGPTRLATAADRVAFSWEVACPSPRALELRSDVLLRRGALAPALRARALGRPAGPRARPVGGRADLDDRRQRCPHRGRRLARRLPAARRRAHPHRLRPPRLSARPAAARRHAVATWCASSPASPWRTASHWRWPSSAPCARRPRRSRRSSVSRSRSSQRRTSGWPAAAARWCAGSSPRRCCAWPPPRRAVAGSVPALTLAGLALFAACYFGLLARVATSRTAARRRRVRLRSHPRLRLRRRAAGGRAAERAPGASAVRLQCRRRARPGRRRARPVAAAPVRPRAGATASCTAPSSSTARRRSSPSGCFGL